MDNEGGRHGLLPHSCCAWTNHYPSIPIYSEMICRVYACLCHPLQTCTPNPATDTKAISAFLSLPLSLSSVPSDDF